MKKKIVKVETTPAPEDRICPLVRSECIHRQCAFWDDRTCCSLKYMGILLDEMLMRMNVIESEITTLQQ